MDRDREDSQHDGVVDDRNSRRSTGDQPREALHCCKKTTTTTKTDVADNCDRCTQKEEEEEEEEHIFHGQSTEPLDSCCNWNRTGGEDEDVEDVQDEQDGADVDVDVDGLDEDRHLNWVDMMMVTWSVGVDDYYDGDDDQMADTTDGDDDKADNPPPRGDSVWAS